MTALSTVTQGLKVAKALRDIDKAVDAADLKANLAEILASLSDAKLALNEAKQELANRDSEIDRLQKGLSHIQELVEFHGFPYAKKADGQPVGKPFCPICIQKNALFVNLGELNHGERLNWVCPSCRSDYGLHIASFSYE